jgi:hypothetical protein
MSTTVKKTGFGSVKTVAKSSAKKTDDKQIHKVTDPTVAQAITDYLSGKKLEEEGKAKKDIAAGIIKPHARGKWIQEFEQTGRKPESFIVANENDSLLFIVQQAYNRSGLDEARVDMLTQKYGEEIVSKTDTFVFDNAILGKYDTADGNVIADAVMTAIQNLAGISQEDKDEIIKKMTKTEVNKEALKDMKKYTSKAGVNAEEFLNDIQPTMQLKGRGEK